MKSSKHNILNIWGFWVKLKNIHVKVCTAFFAAIMLFSFSLKAQERVLQPQATPSQTQSTTTQTSKLGLKNLDIEYAEVNSFFSAFNFDEVQDRSQLVQLAIVPHIKLHLLKNLSFTGMGLIGLSTGRVQTRFDNPQFGSLNLNELILTYSPLENVDIEGGALNQNHLNTSMLIQDRAFPGIQVKNKYKAGKNFEVQLKAQYSIPNSVSFESDRTEVEPLPSFLTQGFDFKWQALEWLKIRGDVHHFTFNNLPSVVAFQSGRLGNTAPGVHPSESFFEYGFDGFSQAYNFDFLVNKTFTPKLNIQMIYNTQAPSDRRQSQWTELGFDWFFKDFVISPSIAYFFADSDSVPALYSDVRLGRNNREGLSYKLRLHFKNSGFSVSANYIQANLIEARPFQNDLRTFEFMLELPSVHF